ncbi:MAG: outer membrane beta-barrel protein [Bacteroidaceae bacterium]|nr:outer membrane beta-barrel protein [Bacteroidaceae bacterium]
MFKYKNLFATALLMLGFTATANAQDADDGLDYKPYPYVFVGVQGGAQTTFTNYDQLKLITPTTSLSIGSFFTPVVGARLHFNGMWNKGGFKNATIDQKYDYKYLTSDLDLMLNLVTLFGRKNYYPLNVYLIGGIGLNYAWDNDDAFGMKNLMPMAYEKDRFSHNARVGAQLDWNIHKNVSLNLEVAANSLSDRYNSKVCNKDDWQLTAQVGVAFKFGYKKKPVKEEVWETRIDTIWYDDIAYSPRVEDGTVTWNVFYKIRESDFGDPDLNDPAAAQLAAIGAFLKDHRECKVTMKSYADVQTGNPKINMGYSQQRSEKAVKALVDAGVDPSIITAEYFGDTVQPFAENDKNRVTIITATGLKDVKDQYTVKKYRTKEVRYRAK